MNRSQSTIIGSLRNREGRISSGITWAMRLTWPICSRGRKKIAISRESRDVFQRSTFDRRLMPRYFVQRYWTSFCRSSPDWITVQVSRGERDIFAVFRGNTSQCQIPGNLTGRSPPGPLRWRNQHDRARWDKRAHFTPSLIDVFRNELVIFYCVVSALTLVAVNFTSSWPIRGMRGTESRIYDPL